MNDDILAEFTVRNAAALDALVSEHGVELRRLPDDVLARLQELSGEGVAETAGENELAARIHESYTRYLDSLSRYHEITEKAYINAR